MLLRLFRTRLGSTVGAMSFGQLAQSIVQLIAVPVFAHAWGLAQYGVWLLLFTIPAYLTISDFGLLGAAANDLTKSVAQDRREEARRTYRTVRLALTLALVGLMAVGGLLTIALGDSMLQFAASANVGNAKVTLLLLIAYGLVALQSQIAMIAMRATGGYAKTTVGGTLVLLGETAAACGAATLGGGLAEVATAYLMVRLCGTLLLQWQLHRHASWLASGGWFELESAELKRLARPALAMFMIPCGFALSLQGMVAVVGAAAGTAAIPLFTTARTLTRSAVQIVAIINHASMPLLTAAAAREDKEHVADIAALSLVTGVLPLLPAGLALAIFGPWIVSIWTGGAVTSSFGLIAAMSLAMVLHGSWRTIANLILALNEHSRFSYAFVALTLGSLVIGYPLSRRFDATGGAFALVLLDSAMLLLVLVQARNIGMISGHSLVTAPARVWRLFLRFRGGKTEV